MLRRLVEHEVDGQIDYGPETEEEPCAICGGEAHPQICFVCRKYHHHGRAHIRTETGAELLGLCHECYAKQAMMAQAR